MNPAFTPVTAAFLILLGLGVGIFGTLVGAGGGFILTPVLLLVYPQSSPALITAISLVVVFFNALSGTTAYTRQRRVDFRSGMVFAACTLPGSVVGVLLADKVPRSLFDVIMGVALIALAVWLLYRGEPPASKGERRGSPRQIVDHEGTVYRYGVNVRLGALLSVGVGFISSFLGIGGGVLHVPLLVTVLGFPTHIATATSHFVLACMALVATLTHIAAGTFHHSAGVRRAVALSIGVVVGAPLGAKLSQRLTGKLIQRLLAGGLLLLGVRLVLMVAF